jgi:hypothetical protein
MAPPKAALGSEWDNDAWFRPGLSRPSHRVGVVLAVFHGGAPPWVNPRTIPPMLDFSVDVGKAQFEVTGGEADDP